MSLLIINNLTKTYGSKTLFEGLNTTIEPADKIGIIGINGTGKSTFLKIIADMESYDSGDIAKPKGLKIEYLPQQPDLRADFTILEQVFTTDHPQINAIKHYEDLQEELAANPSNQQLQDKIHKVTEEITRLDAWSIESKIKTILTKLKITNLKQRVGDLSGGMQKRVALACALISPCDLLILDEPTNHMDNDTILWLEDYLKNQKTALLMVTHDRYFLDRVVNRILELDHGKAYSYPGNYSHFVEKKAERREIANSMERKRQNLYRSELVWIRAGVQGRGTKQRARVNRFKELKHQNFSINDEKMDISVAHRRLGKKVVDIHGISKSYEQPLFSHFDYVIKKDDRIGIIGNNGVGKSTLLNIITKNIEPDNGFVDIGETVSIGYFTQHANMLSQEQKVIEFIQDIAEYVTTEDGTKISASQMLERFLFNSDMQWSQIGKLSGGEQRRLQLLSVLMTSPNLLILDEPTNDLDIETLKILENYLDDFNGIVITVSHDRYFLDRVCNMIFAFERTGIQTFTGNYTDYLAFKEEHGKDEKIVKAKSVEVKPKSSKSSIRKLTFKEKFELEGMEEDIEKLNEQLESIEAEITKCVSEYSKLQSLTEEKDMLELEILEKYERHELLLSIERGEVEKA